MSDDKRGKDEQGNVPADFVASFRGEFSEDDRIRVGRLRDGSLEPRDVLGENPFQPTRRLSDLIARRGPGMRPERGSSLMTTTPRAEPPIDHAPAQMFDMVRPGRWLIAAATSPRLRYLFDLLREQAPQIAHSDGIHLLFNLVSMTARAPAVDPRQGQVVLYFMTYRDISQGRLDGLAFDGFLADGMDFGRQEHREAHSRMEAAVRRARIRREQMEKTPEAVRFSLADPEQAKTLDTTTQGLLQEAREAALHFAAGVAVTRNVPIQDVVVELVFSIPGKGNNERHPALVLQLLPSNPYIPLDWRPLSDKPATAALVRAATEGADMPPADDTPDDLSS